MLLEDELKASPKIPLGGIPSIQLDATCKAALALFSCAPKGANEKDPDGVLKGTQGGVSKAPPALIEAPARPGAERWLKYALEGKLAESVSLPVLQNLKLGFDASQTLRFCDYRRHEGAELLKDCVEADMARCRLVLSVEDIQDLRPGEAVSLRATASLSASVTLSWADVLTSTLGSMAPLLRGGTGGLGVKVEPGLKLSARVRAMDDFRLAFAGMEGGRVRVAVSKAKTREARAGATAGVKAELDFKEADAHKLLGELFGGLYEKMPGAAQGAACDGLLSYARKRIDSPPIVGPPRVRGWHGSFPVARARRP